MWVILMVDALRAWCLGDSCHPPSPTPTPCLWPAPARSYRRKASGPSFAAWGPPCASPVYQRRSRSRSTRGSRLPLQGPRGAPCEGHRLSPRGSMSLSRRFLGACGGRCGGRRELEDGFPEISGAVVAPQGSLSFLVVIFLLVWGMGCGGGGVGGRGECGDELACVRHLSPTLWPCAACERRRQGRGEGGVGETRVIRLFPACREWKRRRRLGRTRGSRICVCQVIPNVMFRVVRPGLELQSQGSPGAHGRKERWTLASRERCRARFLRTPSWPQPPPRHHPRRSLDPGGSALPP